MSEEIVVFEESGLTITNRQYETFVASISTQSPTKEELKLYFYDCARRGVHPLDKLIYFTKRKGRYTPVTSIDYMRMRAETSGAYAGSDDAVFADGELYPSAATVSVYKIVGGVLGKFTATARWDEYRPDDLTSPAAFMWRKMPRTMLAKCAEALALRKAFPGQLHGLYSQEEMAQAGTVVDVDVIDNPKTSTSETPAKPQPITPALLVKAGLAENDFAGKAIIDGLGLVGKDVAIGLVKACLYRKLRETGQESADAFVLTIANSYPAEWKDELNASYQAAAHKVNEG